MADGGQSGGFFPTSLQVLFDRMVSPQVSYFINTSKLDVELLKKLETFLHSANSARNDAENKQIKDSAVEMWLDDLQEANYTVEDLLDEIISQALQFKSEIDQSGGSQIEVCKLDPASLSDSIDEQLGNKIKGILAKLEFIVEQKYALGLKESVRRKSLGRLTTTSLVDESVIYGRNADREMILRWLLSDDFSGDKINVIPIVGPGGIGKTTLAQLLYSDDRVNKHFNLKAWFSIGDCFDVLRITQMIFEEITSQKCEIDDLYQLQIALKNALLGKKFLFVCDDVDVESYDYWNVFSKHFGYGLQGSKVVVTTCSEKTASLIGTAPTYHLQTLSNEDCWLLFSKHAFHNVKSDAHSQLKKIGRQIVKKCKGHPLAIKLLSGLLHFEENPEEWKKVLESDTWEMFDDEGTVTLPSLWLSYHYLSPPLKLCFAYSSMFPKNYEFAKEKLILLWMAEGFLQSSEKQRMVEVGEECLFELMSRSLFQKSSRNGLSLVMHNLVHDFTTLVSRRFYMSLDDTKLQVYTNKTHHLSHSKWKVPNVMKFEMLFRAEGLRTFLSLGWQTFRSDDWNTCILQEALSFARCLRVLSLSGYAITELPDSIGNLKCLRYLDLSYTNLIEMPNIVCTLYNLQILLLSGCVSLRRLPTNIGNLTNLRHLDISNTFVKEIPPQLCNLKNLDSVTNFTLSKRNGCVIKNLREFENLGGRLCISGLQNIANVYDVKGILENKKYLTDLSLKWAGSVVKEKMKWPRHNLEQPDKKLLEALKPHTNLKNLCIMFYSCNVFPKWVGDCSYCNIVSLELRNCKKCLLLPSLGQLPSLRKLIIVGINELTKISGNFYGDGSNPFASLEILHFEDMFKWQEWNFPSDDNKESRVFLYLKELHLQYCPKLITGLPSYLPSLKKLIIDGCEQLVSVLPRDMQIAFPSLQQMKICSSPEIELDCEGNWPPYLNSLTVSYCKKLVKDHTLWDLRKLAFLTYLCISGVHEELDSFPREGLLPLTLTSLYISDLPKLKALNGKALVHLTCLRELHIYLCKELQCLPDEGLPPSLSYLSIYHCQHLKSRCQREKGEDWLKISHIPRVEIDNELV